MWRSRIGSWYSLVLNLAVKSFVNSMQERRKVEEAYVLGLKKLAHKQPPDSHSELGLGNQEIIPSYPS